MQAKTWIDNVNFRDLTERHLVEPFLVHAEISKPGPVQRYGLKGASTTEGKLRIQLETGPLEVNISQYIQLVPLFLQRSSHNPTQL